MLTARLMLWPAAVAAWAAFALVVAHDLHNSSVAWIVILPPATFVASRLRRRVR